MSGEPAASGAMGTAMQSRGSVSGKALWASGPGDCCQHHRTGCHCEQPPEGLREVVFWLANISLLATGRTPVLPTPYQLSYRTCRCWPHPYPCGTVPGPAWLRSADMGRTWGGMWGPRDGTGVSSYSDGGYRGTRVQGVRYALTA